MSEDKCKICEEPLSFRWTDTHGVGACLMCGAPYKILFYDTDSKRIPDRDPLCLIIDNSISILKRYWSEHHRNVAPTAFNFPGSSYEVATQEDCDIYDKWMTEDEETRATQ